MHHSKLYQINKFVANHNNEFDRKRAITNNMRTDLPLLLSMQIYADKIQFSPFARLLWKVAKKKIQKSILNCYHRGIFECCFVLFQLRRNSHASTAYTRQGGHDNIHISYAYAWRFVMLFYYYYCYFFLLSALSRSSLISYLTTIGRCENKRSNTSPYPTYHACAMCHVVVCFMYRVPCTVCVCNQFYWHMLKWYKIIMHIASRFMISRSKMRRMLCIFLADASRVYGVSTTLCEGLVW